MYRLRLVFWPQFSDSNTTQLPKYPTYHKINEKINTSTASDKYEVEKFRLSDLMCIIKVYMASIVRCKLISVFYVL